IRSLAHAGPLLLEFRGRGDRGARAGQTAGRGRRDRELVLVPRSEWGHKNRQVDAEPCAEWSTAQGSHSEISIYIKRPAVARTRAWLTAAAAWGAWYAAWRT